LIHRPARWGPLRRRRSSTGADLDPGAAGQPAVRAAQPAVRSAEPGVAGL